MNVSGTDLFIAFLVVGYVFARWRLHRHLQARRRVR
jgi:hypothetical protein